jgi:hypothetical protein
MARTGRPKTELTLTEQEGEQLVRWARRAKSSQALALRSKIVLACAKGTDNKSVAAQLNCVVSSVFGLSVRGRYLGRETPARSVVGQRESYLHRMRIGCGSDQSGPLGVGRRE